MIRERLFNILAGAIALGAAVGAHAPAARAQDTKITFWNNWDGSRAAQLRSTLDEFERRNPGIKVENVTLSSDTTAQRMLTALASGAVPDLYMTQANDFPRWASLGALQPIDAYVKKDGMDLDKVFFKSSIEGSKWDGKLIQFPFKVPTSLMIWYNKKLFQQAGLDPDNPPQTWEQLEDAARKTTIADGNVIKQLGINICLNCNTGAGSENAFIEWLSRNNGDVLTADAKKPAFNSPAGLETLKWMQGFAERTTGNWSNAVRQFGTTWKDLRPAFYTGRMAMVMDGPFLYNIVGNDAPRMLDDIGVFLAPVNGQNPKARERYLAYGVPGYGIPKGARNPDAAWKLLKFIAADDAGACQFFRMQKRADTPLRDCKTEVPPAFAKVFAENGDLVEAPQAPASFQQIHVRLQQMQEAVLLGKQTPEEALKAAEADVAQILSRTN